MNLKMVKGVNSRTYLCANCVCVWMRKSFVHDINRHLLDLWCSCSTQLVCFFSLANLLKLKYCVENLGMQCNIVFHTPILIPSVYKFFIKQTKKKIVQCISFPFQITFEQIFYGISVLIKLLSNNNYSNLVS